MNQNVIIPVANPFIPSDKFTALTKQSTQRIVNKIEKFSNLKKKSYEYC